MLNAIFITVILSMVQLCIPLLGIITGLLLYLDAKKTEQKRLLAFILGVIGVFGFVVWAFLRQKREATREFMAVIYLMPLLYLVNFLLFRLLDLWTGFVGMGIVLGILFYRKVIDTKPVLAVLFSFLVITHAYYFYFDLSKPTSALNVPRSYGTVLSNNWWDALNWVKNNTAECSVVATYWDPGHFITGIARRAVVFDGASQNALFVRDGGDNSGLSIESYDNGINHIVLEEDNKTYTARIQDISTTLLTSNETLALEILKNYMKPNCSEMYYIASYDLIGKSQWWTYFATWHPDHDPKGQKYFYVTVSRSQPKILENAIVHTYPMGADQAFLLYETEEEIQAVLQQGSQFLTIEKIFFFQNNEGLFKVEPESDVKGLLWVSPGKEFVIYMPPELENSMFTRMFLFNGANLEHFEFVKNWGGEVKLFRVNFPENMTA